MQLLVQNLIIYYRTNLFQSHIFQYFCYHSHFFLHFMFLPAILTHILWAV